jgi:hypothetical protein
MMCALCAVTQAVAASTDPLQVERYKADRAAILHRQDAAAAAALHREDAAAAATLHRADADAALSQTLVDKGLLAALIAIVGFAISRALDRYQALLTADTAVEAKRFEVLDDVWTSMNECEHLKHEVHRLLRRGTRSMHSRRILLEHQAEFESKSATARLKVDQKAHWLGHAAHREITLYHKTLTRLFYAYVQGDVPGVVRFERELARRRQYVADRRRLGGRFQSVESPRALRLAAGPARRTG